MSDVDRLSAALADRYRIERKLGAGGMATVYLAQDLKHDRQVAVKVLRPELAGVIGADRPTRIGMPDKVGFRRFSPLKSRRAGDYLAVPTGIGLADGGGTGWICMAEWRFGGDWV